MQSLPDEGDCLRVLLRSLIGNLCAATLLNRVLASSHIPPDVEKTSGVKTPLSTSSIRLGKGAGEEVQLIFANFCQCQTSYFEILGVGIARSA